jgi:BirA family biotin operon repressor/biotin-[acetyl-CoA-carboxylase] ligase
VWQAEVASTNDVAGVLAEQGAAEGLLVMADHQTAGRGRMGRCWASPAGAGIYASVVLRPPAQAIPLLTLTAGVAVAEGIRASTGLDPDLKWPNDVHIAGRKLAGILAEGAPSYVVLGIGINVLPAAYSASVVTRATSLEAELGRPADRGLVLAECLAALAYRYRVLVAEGGRTIVEAWRQRAAKTLKRQVEWDAGSGVTRGAVEDIDEHGALVVRAGGGLVRITSGEVRWL